MSSTRGLDSPIRHKHDEYITPDWCIRRLLEAYPLPANDVVCLDPCASRGELITVARSMCPDLRWGGYEINPECAAALATVIGGVSAADVCGDFLALPRPATPSGSLLILSNPPYSKAQRFIEQSLAFAQRVIFLLRLNFLADGRNDRAGFARKTNPGVLVLPNRPSFNGWGSDSCEYGWFVYGDPGLSGHWIELGQTPEEETKSWNARAKLRYPDEDPRLRKEAA